MLFFYFRAITEHLPINKCLEAPTLLARSCKSRIYPFCSRSQSTRQAGNRRLERKERELVFQHDSIKSDTLLEFPQELVDAIFHPGSAVFQLMRTLAAVLHSFFGIFLVVRVGFCLRGPIRLAVDSILAGDCVGRRSLLLVGKIGVPSIRMWLDVNMLAVGIRVSILWRWGKGHRPRLAYLRPDT